MRSPHVRSHKRQQPPTQMKILGLGRYSPSFSPHLYSKGKPPEEVAKAQAPLEEAPETQQGRSREMKWNPGKQIVSSASCKLTPDWLGPAKPHELHVVPPGQQGSTCFKKAVSAQTATSGPAVLLEAQVCS